MKLAIVTVTPVGYQHARAFEDVSGALAWGARELGHDVVEARFPIAGRRSIILGANLLGSVGWRLPPDAVIYNLEQIDPLSPWLATLRALRGLTVWDYSPRNAERYAGAGLTPPAAVVPLGWAPTLESAGLRARVPTIDVLFYGSMNGRRAAVLEEVRARGLSVEVAFGAYGADRDRLIARARLVLNVHFYSAAVFEIVRVSYLLANRVPVVSEVSVDGTPPGVEAAGYAHLPEACAYLVANEELRWRRAESAYASFRAATQADALRRPLAAL